MGEAHSVNGTCPAVATADEALRVARNADDSVMHLHESFGGVTREVGKVAIELGALRGAIDKMARRLDKIRPDSDRPVSFHDLDQLREEVTSPGVEQRPSSPVRSAVEKWTGKIVIRVVLFVAGVGGGLAVEHAIMALLHH